jgi:hypothetical protein
MAAAAANAYLAKSPTFMVGPKTQMSGGVSRFMATCLGSCKQVNGGNQLFRRGIPCGRDPVLRRLFY